MSRQPGYPQPTPPRRDPGRPRAVALGCALLVLVAPVLSWGFDAHIGHHGRGAPRVSVIGAGKELYAGLAPWAGAHLLLRQQPGKPVNRPLR